MRYDSILETIGDTPHVRVNRLYDDAIEVWTKLERANPGGSIKDRIALSMIEDAERRGVLKPGTVVIEPTSGNTGVGLAMVCAVKGYRLILVMPDSFSIERRKVMIGYGAELELTPRELGIKGSMARADEIAAELPDVWIPSQFANPANPEVHRRTTAEEIAADFPDGLDYIVWSSNYDTGTTWWWRGDFNGDGYVDGLDYIYWSDNYGLGCPAAVPEPASALVIAIGFLALARRRR